MKKHLTYRCYLGLISRSISFLEGDLPMPSSEVEGICQQLWAEVHILKTLKADWKDLRLVKRAK